MKITLLEPATKNEYDDIDRELEEFHISVMEMAEIDAIHFASQDKPDLNGDDFNTYMERYKTKYERKGAEIQKRERPLSQFHKTQVDIDTFNKEEVTISKKIELNSKQSQNAGYGLKSLGHINSNNRILTGYAMLLAIFISEIIYNARAFQLIVENLLLSIFMSIGVAVSVYMLSSYTASKLQQATNRNSKIRIWILALALMSILFLVLGFIRSKYTESEVTIVSPVIFMILNMFFFIAGVIASLKYMPDRSERKMENAYQLKLREEDRLKKEGMQLEQHRNRLVQIIDEKKKLCIDTAHLTKHVNEVLRKMYMECVANWKIINKANRIDRSSPDCFEQQVNPLDLEELIFRNINNNKK